MLTKKQRELLIFIHERMAGGDIAPSFEEMKDALGLKSKSGIHRLISALVERGYLERLPHRARAIEVRKLPEGYGSNSVNDAGTNDNVSVFDSTYNPQFEQIPIYGKIAAGTPIEAIRNEGSFVDIPANLLHGGAPHYALEVSGDSMINAGINDHDTVIIKRADTAEEGAIVVALVDDEEVTLKRIYRKNGKVILQPENDTHEPRILEPERVKIQGTLVSLFRTYH